MFKGYQGSVRGQVTGLLLVSCLTYWGYSGSVLTSFRICMALGDILEGLLGIGDCLKGVQGLLEVLTPCGH